MGRTKLGKNSNKKKQIPSVEKVGEKAFRNN